MERIKKIWQNIPGWLKNKYALTLIAFFVWLLFFDQHDLITQIKLKTELNQLEDDKAYYLKEIKQTKADLKELMTDKDKLEKFAREKYLMKKDGEDIFVIVEEGEEE